MTIVQDRDTSVVYGMPGEAVRLGGASYVLSPEKIYRLLANLAAQHAGYGQHTNANEQEDTGRIDGRSPGHDLSRRNQAAHQEGSPDASTA